MNRKPHVYVVAEEGSVSPVKIGVTHTRPHQSGRSGLQAGNPRRLVVLARCYGPEEDVRWWEFLIHRRLSDRHAGIGEWYNVADLVADGDWASFIQSVIDGTTDGILDWRIGDDKHHLAAMKRISSQPRQFDAVCSCGAVHEGIPGTTMPTVITRFAVEHLGFSVDDPLLIEIR